MQYLVIYVSVAGEMYILYVCQCGVDVNDVMTDVSHPSYSEIKLDH